LVEKLREAFKGMIGELDWMLDSTKVVAKEKVTLTSLYFQAYKSCFPKLIYIAFSLSDMY